MGIKKMNLGESGSSAVAHGAFWRSDASEAFSHMTLTGIETQWVTDCNNLKGMLYAVAHGKYSYNDTDIFAAEDTPISELGDSLQRETNWFRDDISSDALNTVIGVFTQLEKGKFLKAAVEEVLRQYEKRDIFDACTVLLVQVEKRKG